MKIVKVSYTTSADYAAQNIANVRAVMNELQQLNAGGINYNTCLQEDGKTFIHTAFFKTEEDEHILNELSSFKQFRQALKASDPEVPPKQDRLTLVGTSTEIFKSETATHEI